MGRLSAAETMPRAGPAEASKIEQELWGHVKPIGPTERGGGFTRARYDGLCTRCGKARSIGHRQCPDCREKERDAHRAKAALRPPARVRAHHPSTRLCVVCGCGSTAHRCGGKGTIRWCRRCGKEKCGSFTPKEV